jgi:hypothetical protein
MAWSWLFPRHLHLEKEKSLCPICNDYTPLCFTCVTFSPRIDLLSLLSHVGPHLYKLCFIKKRHSYDLLQEFVKNVRLIEADTFCIEHWTYILWGAISCQTSLFISRLVLTNPSTNKYISTWKVILSGFRTVFQSNETLYSSFNLIFRE